LSAERDALRMKSKISTPSGTLTFVADFIQAGVPLLIGLETLYSNRLQILTLFNQLQHVPQNRDPGLGRGCFLYFAEVVIFIFFFIHWGTPKAFTSPEIS
jgi:hypothetical protein